LDGDGQWTPADDFHDVNGDGEWQPEESLTLDHNGNGVWDPAEPLDDQPNGVYDFAYMDYISVHPGRGGY